MKSVLAREADLFLADLLGEGLPALQESEAARDADFGGDASRWTEGRREPFFGDTRGRCWLVVARPGTRRFALRPDDLAVQRTADGQTWTCTLAEDLDPAVLFRRGRVLRDDFVILRRVRRSRMGPASPPDIEAFPEVVEVCGFFGPNDVRLTEQEIRAAVVARATAEWSAWHTTTGAPRQESDTGMFGRLVGYYLAAKGAVRPDNLTTVQAAALGPISYAALLASGASAATIATEAATIRDQLLSSAPGATDPGIKGLVLSAITQAREAFANAGSASAWSAAFVTGCVRGATVTQGLEAVIAPDRRHIGRDELLLASLAHAAYTVEARQRRAATTPRRRGTYHAFTPAERAPQVGDIIVMDRRDGITPSQVITLATLTALKTHGDIVVERHADSLVTIGGNLGGSSRKRRYPLNAQGQLLVDPAGRFVQENSTGVLPALPAQPVAAPGAQPSTAAANQPLAGQSTGRIFALLSLVEECAAVPGQPYQGGVLT